MTTITDTSPQLQTSDKQSPNDDHSESKKTNSSQPSNSAKGQCAQFLRHNPRFINEPICQVLPNESSTSVAECLQWNHHHATHTEPSENTHKKTDVRGPESTSHSDYQKPAAVSIQKAPTATHQRSPLLHTSGIVPLIDERSAKGSSERISFKHQYNSRTDPNEPIRGKLHGSFVWEKTDAVERGKANPPKSTSS